MTTFQSEALSSKLYPAALVLALAGALGTPLALAQPATTAIRPDEVPAGPWSRLAPEEYWTPERVEGAGPIPWYDERADLGRDPEAGGRPAESGPPGATPGGTGALDRDLALALEASGEALALDEEGLRGSLDFEIPFGTPDVFDSTFLNQTPTLQTSYPWRAIGKLLITAPSGGTGWCSASVISPNDDIVTAAHCCYDRAIGSWNADFTFVPAMRLSAGPYGMFPWASASVLTAWITGGGRPNDVCVLSLNPRSDGETVSNLVGWLGRSWNVGSVRHHFAFGYPSNWSSGNYKFECAAETYANCGDGNVLAMGCNMTFGSSGGPWIRVFKKFSAGARNYVNSVVSGYDPCTGTFGQSFNGARFTSSNIVPLCTAEGC